MEIKELLDAAEKELKIVKEAYHPGSKQDCDIEKILRLVDASNHLQEVHTLITIAGEDNIHKGIKIRYEELFNDLTDAAVDIPTFCKCSRKE